MLRVLHTDKRVSGWRWWRIERDAGWKARYDHYVGQWDDSNAWDSDEDEKIARIEVRVKEIPAWEGERVRAYLRNADLHAAKAFDRKSLLAHTEPLGTQLTGPH